MKYIYSSLMLFYFLISFELLAMQTSASLPDLVESKDPTVVITPLIRSRSLENLQNANPESLLPENLDIEFDFRRYNDNATTERAKQISPEEAQHIMIAHQKLLESLKNVEDAKKNLLVLIAQQNDFQGQAQAVREPLQREESFNAGLYFAGLSALSKEKFNISPLATKRIKNDLVSPRINTESKYKLKISVEKIAKNGGNGINE